MSEYPEQSAHVQKELTGIYLGKFLGEGVYRRVYANQLDPKTVIKIEERACSFSNILEWEIWNFSQHTKEAKQWLAPCVSISPCGTVLIQRRTLPVTKAQLPSKVPAWLTDFKLANWGMLDGKVVCHDYSNNLLMNPVTERKLRRVKFFDYGT